MLCKDCPIRIFLDTDSDECKRACSDLCGEAIGSTDLPEIVAYMTREVDDGEEDSVQSGDFISS